MINQTAKLSRNHISNCIYGCGFTGKDIKSAQNQLWTINVTRFAKRDLIHAIINTEKPYFEIFITVYLKNAWCLVYEILHQSMV